MERARLPGRRTGERAFTSRDAAALLERLGDVFGSPVNLASRLVDEARPRSVLVDAELAPAIEDDGSYSLRRLRRRSVRGYKALTPYLVRRVDDDCSGGARG